MLLGAYGQHNLGDDALLEVFLEQLHGAEIVVNSAMPDSTQSRYGVQALPTQMPAAFWHMVRRLVRADVVVFGGGSLLKDLEGNWLPQLLYNIRLCSALLICRIARVPTCMVAIGCGPFRKRSTRAVARISARLVTSLSVRDNESADLLRSIGIRRHIDVSADPVFTWAGRFPPLTEHPDSPPILAMVPRYSLTAKELQLLAHLCDRWIEERGGRVQLLAFQTGFLPRFDDVAACKSVQQLMTHREHADILVPTSPRDAIESIARANLLVSVRLHALIFAALEGVPMAALSYDPKVRSLMHSIEQSDAVIDLASCDAERAEELIDRVWETRAARAELISAQIVRAKARTEEDLASLFARFGHPIDHS